MAKSKLNIEKKLTEQDLLEFSQKLAEQLSKKFELRKGLELVADFEYGKFQYQILDTEGSILAHSVYINYGIFNYLFWSKFNYKLGAYIDGVGSSDYLWRVLEEHQYPNITEAMKQLENELLIAHNLYSRSEFKESKLLNFFSLLKGAQ